MAKRKTAGPVQPQRITEHLAVCRELAGPIAISQQQIPRICQSYTSHRDFQRFFAEFSDSVSGFLPAMDAEIAKGEFDLGQFHLANAGNLQGTGVRYGFGEALTAHEAIWIIGALIGVSHNNCRMLPGIECADGAVAEVESKIKRLPSAFGFQNAMTAESVRWSAWVAKNHRGKRATKRTPKNAKRDEQFAKSAEKGVTAKSIAANWNLSNPDDDVSEETVRQAIKRFRDKS